MADDGLSLFLSLLFGVLEGAARARDRKQSKGRGRGRSQRYAAPVAAPVTYAASRLAEVSAPVERKQIPNNFLAIKCETTGLGETARIVSYASVSVVNGMIVDDYCYYIFDPHIPNTKESLDIHGLTDGLLKQQDDFWIYAMQIHRRVAAADLVVGHHIRFVFDMLNREFQRCGLPPLGLNRYCTRTAYADLFPRREHSLRHAAKALGIPISMPYSAMSGAWLTAQVYLALNCGAASLNWPPLPSSPVNLRPIAAQMVTVSA